MGSWEHLSMMHLVAPGHQTGRGLKHKSSIPGGQHKKVAPGHQTGRGLKHTGEIDMPELQS